MSSRKNPYRYRFGLYGYKGAGKTCILAALAISDAPHDGIAMSWHEQPADDWRIVRWLRSNRRLSKLLRLNRKWREFHYGTKWLTEAQGMLRAGELPEGNVGGLDLRLQYSIVRPPDRNSTVEIIDYSGELVNTDDQKLRRAVRRHFRNLDGFIILAEYPGRSGEDGGAGNHITGLTNAFMQLARERQKGKLADCPIVVAINKWDWHPEARLNDIAEETSRLHYDLNSPRLSAHAKLWASVQAVVPQLEEQDGEIRKAADILPVSALGPSFVPRTTTQTDESVPAKVQLKSFGLEHAFHTLVLLKDAVDFHRLKTNQQRASAWRFWDIAAHRTLRPKVSSLLRRQPNNPAYKSLASLTRRTALRVAATQLLGVIVLAIATQQGLMVREDYPKVQAYLAFRSKEPAARSPEQIKPFEAWLSEYALNDEPHIRLASYLFLLGRNTAIEQLAAMRSEREQKMRDRLRKAPVATELGKEAALAYIAEFPDGPYRRNADIRLKRYEHIKQINQYRTTLNTYSTRLARMEADTATSSDQFAQFADALEAMVLNDVPEDKAFTDLQNQIETLRDFKFGRLEKARVAEIRARCREHRYSLDQALSEGSFELAAGYHELLTRDCPDTAPSAQEFMQRLNAAFEQFAHQHVSAGAFNELVQKISPATQSTTLLALDESTGHTFMPRANELLDYAYRISERDLYLRLSSAWNTWDPLSTSAAQREIAALLRQYQLNYGSGLAANAVEKAFVEFRNLTDGAQTIQVRVIKAGGCLQNRRYELIITLARQRLDTQYFGRDDWGFPGSCTSKDFIFSGNTTDIAVSNLSANVPIQIELEGKTEWADFSKQNSGSYSGTIGLGELRSATRFGLTGNIDGVGVWVEMINWPKKTFEMPDWNFDLEPPAWLPG